MTPTSPHAAPTAPAPPRDDADAPRTFHVITFGCQMNEVDSDIMRAALRDRGLAETADEAAADVILVNTCAVRDGAEERAFGRLEALRRFKRTSGTLLGMTGCVAQEHGAAILDRLPFLDLVIGTRDLLKVGQLVEQVWRTGDRAVCVDDIDLPLPLPVRVVDRARPLKAMVTIMLGCDKECTYCIVPKTRGAEWSRPLAEVLEECSHLIRHGYREIMLLGQNVNSYRGATDDPAYGVARPVRVAGREEGETPAGVAGFADLLRELDALGARLEERGEGRLLRIRYTTSHPIDASDNLWEAMRDAPRVAPQLHLPVQSGSDRVLRRMKRLYRREHYLERVASLRRHVPGVALTTDFIVGFCGETDEDFEETMSLAREVRFDQAYMFMYSPRAGTPAADRLPDDVPEAVKKERLHRLIALQEAIAEEKNAARVGATFEVMVEGASKRPEGWLTGRTPGDVVVNFPSPDPARAAESWAGELVAVRITEASAHTLRGEVAGG